MPFHKQGDAHKVGKPFVPQKKGKKTEEEKPRSDVAEPKPVQKK